MKTLITVLLFMVMSMTQAQPAVNSHTGVCRAIENHLNETLGNPRSVRTVEVSHIIHLGNGNWLQRYQYRAENVFGARQVFEHFFEMTGEGSNARVIDVYTRREFQNLSARMPNSYSVRAVYNYEGQRIE